MGRHGKWAIFWIKKWVKCITISFSGAKKAAPAEEYVIQPLNTCWDCRKTPKAWFALFIFMIYVISRDSLRVGILARNHSCDTKSRNYRLFNKGFDPWLNPAFRRCDPMEACAHGVSMMGMKPSWQCAEASFDAARKPWGGHAPGSSIRVRG